MSSSLIDFATSRHATKQAHFLLQSHLASLEVADILLLWPQLFEAWVSSLVSIPHQQVHVCFCNLEKETNLSRRVMRIFTD